MSDNQDLNSIDGLKAWLTGQLASRLELDPRDIDISERFSRYGLKSAVATSMVSDLSKELGRKLMPTLVWDHPTIEKLSQHLASGETAASAGETSAPAAPAASGSRENRPAVENEPIAIVGMACRFPHSRNLEEYWNLLKNGVDAIEEVPSDRWSLDEYFDEDTTVPGKMSTRWGGFLDQVDQFDPRFFSISPREATMMDPAQRLVLELCWEALEDAGVHIPGLVDSLTGVYIGNIWNDYGTLCHRGNTDYIEQYTSTGSHYSIIANRVSYVLGLQGPSMAVDTACSSSLVSVHLACQAIRSGEATMAMAGGVNLIIAPDSTVNMSKFGAMAPDGRSKAFDHRANGYVRGEGAGIIVLKPLSAALADGDPIYSVIRGSAVNNDGPSNGLTAPNPLSQQNVLKMAYQNAGIPTKRVHYVETHGTGTMLGDPLEAGALGAVLGAGRADDRPLVIGSVKTNIGHLEGAAGIAGLIKLVLSIKNRAIPASLHFEKPNPHIPFKDIHVQVNDKFRPWPYDEPVVAGVSGFGFGGTNAHVVLEEYSRSPAQLLPLSGESPEALRKLAGAMRDSLKKDKGDSLAEICFAAAGALSAGRHRLAVTAGSQKDMVRQLNSYLEDRAKPGIAAGEVAAERPRIVFFCPGQGGQWLGMSQELMRTEPVFRAALEQCDEAIRGVVGWSLLDELNAEAQYSRIVNKEIDVIQPSIWAMQIAQAALWKSWGILPDVVVGHSMGEVAAAYIAGILSLEDSARVICVRSVLAKKAAGKGGMAVVDLPAGDCEGLIAPADGRVSVASCNSPTSTVLSGDSNDLKNIFNYLESQEIFCRLVNVDFASHSSQMDPLLDELFNSLRAVKPQAGTARLLSTVTADYIEGAQMNASYWVRNLRETVQFAQALKKVMDDGCDTFLEMSPHPVLSTAVEQTINYHKGSGTVLPSTRREEDERLVMLESLGRLHALGCEVNWGTLYSDARGDYGLASGVLKAAGSPETRSLEPERTNGDLFLVSARGKNALGDFARSMAEYVKSHEGVSIKDLSYTTALKRYHHDYRLSIIARGREELIGGLEKFAAGEDDDRIVAGRIDPKHNKKMAFVFADTGEHWYAMGRELQRIEPVFRNKLQEVDDLFQRHADWSIVEELARDKEQSRIDEIAVAQPCLFAVQVALTSLWKHWSIEPTAVVGQGVGEVAAAVAAGLLELQDAALLVYHRGRLMQEAKGSVQKKLAKALAGVTPLEEGSRKMYSSQHQRVVASWEIGAEYWGQGAREAGPLTPVLDEMIAEGYTNFLELGAHPVLTDELNGCLEKAGRQGTVVHSLTRNLPERVGMLRSLSTLYTRGYPIRWNRMHRQGGRFVKLPPYPWQRQRFWVDKLDVMTPSAMGAAAGGDGLTDQERAKFAKSVKNHEGLPVVLPFSGSTENALRDRAKGYAAYIRSLPAKSDLVHLAHSLSVGRDSRAFRFSAAGNNSAELADMLEAYAQGQERPALFAGRAGSSRPKLVFVSSGQGPRFWPLAAELMDRLPAFRATIDRCDTELRKLGGWSLIEKLTDPKGVDMTRTEFTQPGLCSIQMALFEVWKSWGVKPDAVVGHSMGEVPAAYIAGALDLKDAMRVIYHRGRLIQGLCGLGKMAFVDLPPGDIRPYLEGFENLLSIAANNSPGNVVISGDPGALTEVSKKLESDEIFHKVLESVDFASHSPQMEAIQDDFRAALEGIEPRATESPFYSTVKAAPVDGKELGPDYWATNIRMPVLFSDAVNRLIDEGHHTFVEIAPHPALSGSVGQCLSARGVDGTLLPSLHRDEDKLKVLYGSLGGLFTAGYPVDFARIFPGEHYRKMQPDFETAEKPSPGAGARGQDLPLIGGRLRSARNTVQFETVLTGDEDHLRDHVIFDTKIVPGAGYLAMALQAAREISGSPGWMLENVDFQEACVLPEGESRALQLLLAPSDSAGSYDFEILSCAADDPPESAEWSLHVRGSLGSNPTPTDASLADYEKAHAAADETIEPAGFYEQLAKAGYRYGPLFQWAREIRRRDGESVSVCAAPDGFSADEYVLFPGLLDSIFQQAFTGLPGGGVPKILGAGQLYVPLGLNSLRLYGSLRGQVRTHFTLDRTGAGDGEMYVGDIRVFDESDQVVLEVLGLQMKRTSAENITRPSGAAALSGVLFEVNWRPQALESAADLGRERTGDWLVFAPAGDKGSELITGLRKQLDDPLIITPGDAFTASEEGISLRSDSPDDFHQLVEAIAESDIKGILFFWHRPSGEAKADGKEVLERAPLPLLYLVQALGAKELKNMPRLWTVTIGAQAVDGAEKIFPDQTALTGFHRVLANEFSELDPSLIDLGTGSTEEVTGLLREIAGEKSEREIALRGAERFVARLVPVSHKNPVTVPAYVRPDATYLVTGGLGGLGLLSARWLAEKGAGCLALLGRSDPTPAAREEIAAMERAGAKVLVLKGDIGQAQDAARIMQELAKAPALKGVLHAAGVLRDAAVQNMKAEAFRTTAESKVSGTGFLHEATKEMDLDWFVLFSSAAAIFGSAGQINYSTANAFMDGVAHHRRAAGLPATSINWSAWSEVGLAAAQANRGDRLADLGLGSITPDMGLAALEWSLTRNPAQITVMPIVVERYFEASPGAAQTPLFEELLPRTAETSPTPDAPAPDAPEPTGFIAAYGAASEPEERRHLLEEHLREVVAQSIKIAPEEIEPDVPLRSLGLDSLMSLEIRKRLEQSLSLKLSTTMMFNYPTLETLTGFLGEKLPAAKAAPAKPEPKSAPAPAPAKPPEPVPAKPAESAASPAPPSPANESAPAAQPVAAGSARDKVEAMGKDEAREKLAGKLASLKKRKAK